MGELNDLLVNAYDKSVTIDETKTNLYEENDQLRFEEFVDEDRVVINGFIGRTNIGYVILEYRFNAYSEFDGIMDEDDFYNLFPDGNFIEIETLLIKDEFKNKGYGKELLKKAIEYAKSNNQTRVYLNASPMGNTGLALPELVSFYKKFGFEVIPQTDKWEENKEMVLKL
jgi:GNAT superfamily N-acetyltransferase